MKRFAIALALVAMVSACKKQEQSGQTGADTTQMADSMKAMSDTAHMAGDTAKKM